MKDTTHELILSALGWLTQVSISRISRHHVKEAKYDEPGLTAYDTAHDRASMLSTQVMSQKNALGWKNSWLEVESQAFRVGLEKYIYGLSRRLFEFYKIAEPCLQM
jgi:hypothetical protein